MKKTGPLSKLLNLFILTAFISAQIVVPAAQAQQLPAMMLNLPVGSMIKPTAAFQPVQILGLNIDVQNPLRFEFIVDKGDTGFEGDEYKRETEKVIKYFISSLAMPENQMWVNLSPYEANRIIPQEFGRTEMGRDLLALDYMLKQLVSSLMYPKDELGEKFWTRVKEKAQAQFGTSDIPMNTFNKIWIVPETANIYEHANGAFVTDSRLKVMLEEDYLALSANQNSTQHGLGEATATELEPLTGVSADVVREVLIPELEREVNEGEIFANLRQIYNTVILAGWYKTALKDSLLGQAFVDQYKTEGQKLNDPAVIQNIYERYVDAFKTGVYNYMEEEYDPATQTTIPRKYFSGGADLDTSGIRAIDPTFSGDTKRNTDRFVVDFSALNAEGVRPVQVEADAARLSIDSVKRKMRTSVDYEISVDVGSIVNRRFIARKTTRGELSVKTLNRRTGKFVKTSIPTEDDFLRKLNRAVDDYAQTREADAAGLDVTPKSPLKRLLILDDDEMSLSILSNTMRHAFPNAEIVTAGSVEEAKQKIGEAETPFDAVVSDFRLTGHDYKDINTDTALAVLDVIKALPNEQQPKKVIVGSSHFDPGHEDLIKDRFPGVSTIDKTGRFIVKALQESFDAAGLDAANADIELVRQEDGDNVYRVKGNGTFILPAINEGQMYKLTMSIPQEGDIVFSLFHSQLFPKKIAVNVNVFDGMEFMRYIGIREVNLARNNPFGPFAMKQIDGRVQVRSMDEAPIEFRTPLNLKSDADASDLDDQREEARERPYFVLPNGSVTLSNIEQNKRYTLSIEGVTFYIYLSDTDEDVLSVIVQPDGGERFKEDINNDGATVDLSGRNQNVPFAMTFAKGKLIVKNTRDTRVYFGMSDELTMEIEFRGRDASGLDDQEDYEREGEGQYPSAQAEFALDFDRVPERFRSVVQILKVEKDSDRLLRFGIKWQGNEATLSVSPPVKSVDMEERRQLKRFEDYIKGLFTYSENVRVENIAHQSHGWSVAFSIVKITVADSSSLDASEPGPVDNSILDFFLTDEQKLEKAQLPDILENIYRKFSELQLSKKHKALLFKKVVSLAEYAGVNRMETEVELEATTREYEARYTRMQKIATQLSLLVESILRNGGLIEGEMDVILDLVEDFVVTLDYERSQGTAIIHYEGKMVELYRAFRENNLITSENIRDVRSLLLWFFLDKNLYRNNHDDKPVSPRIKFIHSRGDFVRDYNQLLGRLMTDGIFDQDNIGEFVKFFQDTREFFQGGWGHMGWIPLIILNKMNEMLDAGDLTGDSVYNLKLLVSDRGDVVVNRTLRRYKWIMSDQFRSGVELAKLDFYRALQADRFGDTVKVRLNLSDAPAVELDVSKKTTMTFGETRIAGQNNSGEDIDVMMSGINSVIVLGPQKGGAADSATLTFGLDEVGGIDLNRAIGATTVQRDGEGFQVAPIDPVLLKQIENALGLVPVIINVAPITNLPLLLGLGDGLPEDDRDRAERDLEPFLDPLARLDS